MTDVERITLLGGPHDGRPMEHDGGDFLELPANSVPVLCGDKVITRVHVYRRAMFRRDIFTWQGARS